MPESKILPRFPQQVRTREGRPLQVRRLQPGDSDALRQFNHSLSDASRDLFLPHPYDEATMAQVLQRSKHGKDLTLGLFAGQAMIGYFFLWYFTERVPLLGIGLADRFQGRGLGLQMMELLIEAAKDNGNEGIELTTLPENQAAFSLYRKTGFRYIGEVQNLDGDGRQVTERAMFLELVPGARPFDREHRPPV